MPTGYSIQSNSLEVVNFGTTLDCFKNSENSLCIYFLTKSYDYNCQNTNVNRRLNIKYFIFKILDDSALLKLALSYNRL